MQDRAQSACFSPRLEIFQAIQLFDLPCSSFNVKDRAKCCPFFPVDVLKILREKNMQDFALTFFLQGSSKEILRSA